MNNEEIALQDKMNGMHRDMLRVILKVNEVPMAVVEQYFVIKKVIDKVDGRLNVIDLLRIAMDVGFNPATGRFEEKKEVIVTTNLDPVATTGCGNCREVETVVDLTDELKGEGEDIIEEVAEALAEEDDGEFEDETPELETVEDTDPDSDIEVLAEGTVIEAYYDGDIIKGKIVKGFPVADGVQYTVEKEDGEEIELSEDEIEEI